MDNCCRIHLTGWFKGPRWLTKSLTERTLVWFQNLIETLNGQGWLTKIWTLTLNAVHVIGDWKTQLREVNMVRLCIVNITTGNCLATAIMVMFMDWKFAKVMQWLPCRIQRKKHLTIQRWFNDSLAECRKKHLTIQRWCSDCLAEYRKTAHNTKMIQRQPCRKVKKQAPSYARRLQSETMTHWLNRWQE